jgi:hypothetical protein
MADSFDPYYTWLGIPPEEQPADHYRLLGVRRFESNPEVIVNAADQRMVYVRTFQTGKRMKESQRLLNEISAAQLCLVDPSKRKAYDEALQQKLAQTNQAATVASVAPVNGSPVQSQPGSKSAIRSATPLPVAAPLKPHVTPPTPVIPAAPLTPLQPVIVSQANGPAAVVQVQTTPNFQFEGVPSASIKPSKPQSAARPTDGLTMATAIAVGGGSFLLGALVLAGVIIWAATRPAPVADKPSRPTKPRAAANGREHSLPTPDRGAPPPGPSTLPPDPGNADDTSPTPTPSAPPRVAVDTAPIAIERDAAPIQVVQAGMPGALRTIVPAVAQPGRKLVLSSEALLLATCDSANGQCSLAALVGPQVTKSFYPAREIVFSRDETKFAVLWPDNRTEIFQLNPLTSIARLPIGPVQSATFSGDGRWLALAVKGEQPLLVYDLQTKTMLDRISTSLSEVAWLGARDVTLVCWSPEQKAEVIDLVNGERHTLDKIEFPPFAVSKTGQPSLSVLHRVGLGRLSVYRHSLVAGQGSAEIHLEHLSDPATVLAASPDGLLFAQVRDGDLIVRRTHGDADLTRIEFPGGKFHAAAITGEQGVLAFNGPNHAAVVAGVRQLVSQPRWQLAMRDNKIVLESISASPSGAPGRSAPSPTPAPIAIDDAAGRAAIAKLRAAGLQLPDEPQAVNALRIQNAVLDPELVPLWAQFPRLQRLEFFQATNVSEILAKLPALPAVDNLQLNATPVTDDDLQHLVRLPRLNYLALFGTQVKGPGLAHLRNHEQLRTLNIPHDFPHEAIAEICKLTQLEAVYGWPQSTTDDDLKLIAGMDNLTQLQLSSAQLQGHGLAHLSQMPKVRSLSLPRGLAPGSLVHITNLPLQQFSIPHDTPAADLVHLQKMESLEHVVPPEGLTDEGLEILAQLPALKSLSLSSCRQLTDEGLQPLASNRTISHINLAEQFTDAGLKHLAKMPQLEMLIGIMGEGVTDAGIASLKTLPKLRIVELGPSNTDACLRELAQFPALDNLNIRKSRVTSKGFGELKGMTKLRQINLMDVPLTDEAVAALGELSQLRSLIVQGYKLSPRQMEVLKKALPQCNVLNINTNS